DVTLVRIPREVRHEGDCRRVLINDAAAILAFRLENVLKQNASCLLSVPAAHLRLVLNGLEHKVRRVKQAVRMWIRNPDNLSFVLESQYVIHLGTRPKLGILIPPGHEEVFDLG